MVTYREQLQRIVHEYRKADQPWPAQAKQIAAWAIEEKLWEPHPGRILSQCAEEIVRAMREEYIIDRQGRTVRVKHAARIAQEGEQKVLWDDIRTASPEHMQMAFQQRRQQIVGDCRQLKLDVDSYNENANPGPSIQLSLDFSADVEELEAVLV